MFSQEISVVKAFIMFYLCCMYKHISRHIFGGEEASIVAPFSQRWGRTAPNFGRTYIRRRWSPVFGTGVPQMSKLGQIRIIWSLQNFGRIGESKRNLIIGALAGCFIFLISCSISKPELVKCDWCRKSTQNFVLFDHFGNIYTGRGWRNV